MKKTIFMGLSVMAFTAVMIASSVLPNLAYATNNGNSDCGDRGLANGCSPGQHINNKKDGRVVEGNPHYTQAGGDRTGDPHGDTFANDDKGDPHYHPDE